MNQVFQILWQTHQQVLCSQGLNQTSPQSAWESLRNWIKDTISGGKAVNVTGLCKISMSSPKGLSVVLSDQLLEAFPHLQLGRGCVHLAAVKRQVQGAESLNYVKLAIRYPAAGLSKGVLQLLLKLIISTVYSLLASQQSFAVDLGVGQLRFAGGRVAEFTVGATAANSAVGHQSPVVGNSSSNIGPNKNAECSAGSLTPDLLLQHNGPSAPSDRASQSVVSRAPRVYRASLISGRSKVTEAGVAGTSSTGKELSAAPDGISNAALQPLLMSSPRNWPEAGVAPSPNLTPITPNMLATAKREAAAAAKANARYKPATFILPAGAPGEEAEKRMPQGKARPSAGAAATGHAQQQVLAAAVTRQQEAVSAQAAAEAALADRHTQLKEMLDQQAQKILQQREASKKQLADILAQQIRDKQASQGIPQRSKLVLLSSPATDGPALTAASQRLQQQHKYKVALDQQLADKTAKTAQTKANEVQAALAELAVVQQQLVAHAQQASRSSRQKAAEAVRQQLDRQIQWRQGRLGGGSLQ